MNPELIMTLQTVKSCDISSVGRSTKRHLDPSIAAAICNGLGHKYYLAARLYYCRDLSGHQLLEKELFEVAETIGYCENWKMKRNQGLVKKMIVLAIVEMYGVPFLNNDTQRAIFLGIDKANYSRTWKKRYDVLYKRLDSWRDQAAEYIKTKC